MNFTQAENAVQSHFYTEWGDKTPVAWPDIDFDPPDETWVRFTMRNNDAYQASIGNPGSNYHRRIGLVTIQVFQPQGQAGQDARVKADLAADIFIANGLSGITFKNVNARAIGHDGNGYYQINVTAEFQYDRLT
tara:strand:+ start:54 stop:455 length:402 start_codon:yes stop_codon:yes gene_type:complete